jgi:HD-GYP domain-containing protein (c-di-GMP phosphodiesterase class II)
MPAATYRPAAVIGLLIAGVTAFAGLLFLTWRGALTAASSHPVGFTVFIVVALLAFVLALLAFVLPPALLMLSARQRIQKTQASAAEVEGANKELTRSNVDLTALLEFATGLAAQTDDSRQVARYAQASLAGITGARVVVTVGDEAGERAGPLCAAGRVVGGLLVDGGDAERWARLRGAIEPQLATALASAMRAEEVRRTDVETIAALSRSMEAKDDYTGLHMERISHIAVGLAKRLGYCGADLGAVEIGALMHDVGKIGIPESILHKPGPLDDDEWIVMKRHPVISELIMSDIDLSPIVLQIARSSHERMDGRGYPDGLAGEEIPLPARIVLVANAFDALTTDRSYRRARRPKAALEEIVANSGKQFCPDVVEVLERMYREEPHVLGEIPLNLVATA